jgi:hypothetical protein
MRRVRALLMVACLIAVCGAMTTVTSAADAVFTILESEGLIGHAADRALAACAGDGLQPGGWRAQVSLNEAHRLPSGPDCSLPSGPDCSGQGDVFALPASRSRP